MCLRITPKVAQLLIDPITHSLFNAIIPGLNEEGREINLSVGFRGRRRRRRLSAWLPDGYSQIVGVWLDGLWLCYAAKFDPLLSLECVGAKFVA